MALRKKINAIEAVTTGAEMSVEHPHESPHH